MPTTSRVIHQVARPDGFPTAEQFAFADVPMPVAGAGQAVVENLYLSVDPYMRQAMDEDELRTPMEGRSIGRVVDSREPALPVGAIVFHRQSWRTHALLTAGEGRVLAAPDGVPLTAYLGLLGGTGLSAYVALTRIACLRPGETVFVSAAGGGVGTATARLARLLGAGRVIGSTGSAAKAAYLVEHLGFDAALDHSAGDLPGQLAVAAPEGVDVAVENVGGDHLEAAIGAMRDHGRIAWCGAIGQYHAATPPPAPRNLFDLVGKQVRLEGFLVRDHRHLQAELEAFLLPHLRSGAVVSPETVVDGFDHMVEAFLSLLRGGNTGKMIVRVAS